MTKNIKPGDYYLNVVKEGEDWKEGEFCPIRVFDHGNVQPTDGMYGLVDDVHEALTLRDGERSEEAMEDDVNEAMDAYEGTMLAAIGKGEVEGVIPSGLVGLRKWRVVVDTANQHGWQWDATK